MDLFFKSPIQQIIDELNDKNKATLQRPLTITDLTFQEVSSNSDTGLRQVIARAKEGSEYFGAIRNPGVTYHRYVGNLMFKAMPRIWGVNGETYPTLIKRMANLYNIPEFTIEPVGGDTSQPYDFGKDVQNQKINQPDDNWLNVTLPLQFRNDSIGWVGICPIVVYNSKRDLSQIITSRNLDALVYPDDTKGAVGSLSTLTYPIDFNFDVNYDVLKKVGNKLPTDSNDPLVASIISQIVDYYSFSQQTDAMTTELNKVIPGAEVLSTDLDQTSLGKHSVVLKAVAVQGATYIGNIYINGIEPLSTK